MERKTSKYINGFFKKNKRNIASFTNHAKWKYRNMLQIKMEDFVFFKRVSL